MSTLSSNANRFYQVDVLHHAEHRRNYSNRRDAESYARSMARGGFYVYVSDFYSATPHDSDFYMESDGRIIITRH